MSVLKTEDFYAVGMNADQITGWEAQIALRTRNIVAVWPEHFHGKRVRDF